MQKPKGTKDNFGFKQNLRQYVFDTLKEVSTLFNVKKIETPIFEAKDVFVRSVGETSDIVTKEMYAFKDKANRELVLRPEGTAGTIRAIVENKLYALPMPLKLYYEGPMFRYERPQAGRQRQFTQYGLEVLAPKSPYLDVEVILMAATILDALKIDYSLKINSLGNKETREKWSLALKEYFTKFSDQLTEDSQKRIESNPMRILDDKIDSKKDFVKKAPKISDFYSKETKNYFKDVTGFLDSIGIDYQIDQNLVRGLDYYTDTTFEFVSKQDVAQSTIIGGGRYENLISQFGGPELSGIGFGLGIERLVNDLETQVKKEDVELNPDIYVINIDASSTGAALGVVYMLRRAGYITAWNYKPIKIAKGFEKAEKTKAKILIIAGPKELENSTVNVKINKKQENVKIDNLVEYIDKKMGEIYEDNK